MGERPDSPKRIPELRSETTARVFRDIWPACSAGIGVLFILVDFVVTGSAHIDGLSGIGMAFCGIFPVVSYDRARKGHSRNGSE